MGKLARARRTARRIAEAPARKAARYAAMSPMDRLLFDIYTPYMRDLLNNGSQLLVRLEPTTFAPWPQGTVITFNARRNNS